MNGSQLGGLVGVCGVPDVGGAPRWGAPPPGPAPTKGLFAPPPSGGVPGPPPQGTIDPPGPPGPPPPSVQPTGGVHDTGVRRPLEEVVVPRFRPMIPSEGPLSGRRLTEKDTGATPEHFRRGSAPLHR